MMLVHDLNRLSVVMFGSAVLAVGIGVNQLRAALPDLLSRPIRSWQPELGALPELIEGPTTQLREALSRPLFRASRRPYDPAAAIQQPEPQVAVAEQRIEPPPPDASQLLVKGIMMDGKKRLALVATVDAPEGVWLGLGSQVSGWTIAELNRDGITLAAGNARTTLKLYVDNP